MTTIDHLVTELLAGIFCNLDYLTLHLKIRLVCRRFDEIIISANSGPLGDRLFRQSARTIAIGIQKEKTRLLGKWLRARAPKNATRNKCCEIHPCLLKTLVETKLSIVSQPGSRFHEYTPKVARVGFRNSKTSQFMDLSSSPIRLESAFGPKIHCSYPWTNASGDPSLNFPFVSYLGHHPNVTVEEFVQYCINITDYNSQVMLVHPNAERPSVLPLFESISPPFSLPVIKGAASQKQKFGGLRLMVGLSDECMSRIGEDGNGNVIFWPFLVKGVVE